jgi:hypothetical protein
MQYEAVTINLGLLLPTGSSNQPESIGRANPLSYLILLRIGFTKLPLSPTVLVSSYLAFSPLPPAEAG